MTADFPEKASPSPSVSGFARCMVLSDPLIEARQRRVRQRALGVSVIFECAALAAFLIYPLFTPLDLVARREAWLPIPPYGPPAATSERIRSSGNRSHSGPGPIAFPHSTGVHVPVARPIARDGENDSPGPSDSPLGEMFGSSDPALVPLGDLRPHTVPERPQPIKPAPPEMIRRSEGVQVAMLIHRVEPVYPPIAKQTHTEGTVQLHAIIARDGSIASLEALSGHPLLIRAAREAVSQWRYRPTLLGGEPVEVETYITVIFRLGDR